MSDIHSTFACIVCLLPLLSLSLSLAQQPPFCGWPVNLSSVNTRDVKRAENGNVSCDVMFHPGLEPSINVGRSCPPSYRRRHDVAGDVGGGRSQRFPITWYEVECHCRRARFGMSRIPGPCATMRMPVTELRLSRRGHGNQSRLYYTEVTRLRSVDCDILLPPALKEPMPPTVLTGDILRRLGRQVGQGIFMPVNCCRHHASVSFGIDLQKDRLPAMLPEARCPCPGQAAVFLPISVLRRVWNKSGDGMVRSDIQVLPVSCALLLNTSRLTM